ncbi:hypothetical protein ACFLTD_03220 [Elusimicrobiota bacterium]
MKLKYLLAVLFIMVFTGCKGEKMVIKIDIDELKDISQEEWDKLAEKDIFFGHQSVGNNIIDGINDILSEVPGIRAPVFAHAGIGQNKDPFSKIDHFKDMIDNGLGDKVNIAFFKFCYVDITEETDINNVFDHYKTTMDDLGSRYPDVKFLHCTVPLMTMQSGLKAKIKRVLGKSLWGEKDNIKRNMYNRMLIEEYNSTDKLFDLADYESTYPDGTKNIFKKGSSDYRTLIQAYTDDGGHLNKLGRKAIAKQLLLFLKKQ